MTIRIDLFGKYALKCPECGEEYDIRDGYFKCLDCGCELWTPKECRKRGRYLTPPSERKSHPIVTCPYCHSINTSKISDTRRVLGALFGGVYALPLMSKEWHCNNCNSDF